MTPVHRPEDEDALQSMVAQAHGAGTGLELVGGGSKRGFGHDVHTATRIDLTGLAGITLYRPSELVLRARAGTAIAAITQALDAEGQCLPFEPPDWAGLLGTGDRRPTLGGVISCGLAGPARIARGGARDFVLGVAGVNGAGERISSGGRVMKNVTGFDLAKLATGAHGTLAALSEITVKVLPKPETSATLAMPGVALADAPSLLARALGTPYEVTGAAWLPAAIADPVAGLGTPGLPVALLRLEGFADQVRYRLDRLRDAVEPPGDTLVLDQAASETLWRGIGDAALLPVADGQAVWRLSVTPSRTAAILDRIGAGLATTPLLDWGGGLVWLAVPADGDGGAGAIRQAVGAHGHATLVRAPDGLRARTPVFHPEPEPVTALTARIRQAFDPKGILNPGRMAAPL